MRGRAVAFTLLLLFVGLPLEAPSTEAAATFTLDSLSTSLITLDSNFGPTADTFTVNVRNSYSGAGDHPSISITNAGSYSANSISIICTSACGSSIGPNSTLAMTFQASISTGAVSGDYSASWTITSSVGTVNPSLTVRVRTPGVLQSPTTVSAVSKTLECGQRSLQQTQTFTITYSNTGDYSLTVYSPAFSYVSSHVTFENMDSFPFTLTGKNTATKTFRARFAANTPELTSTITASTSTSRNSASGTAPLTVTHPVNVQLPTDRAHDFGNLPLHQTSPAWPIPFTETCGYKNVAFTIDPPQTSTPGLNPATFSTITPSGPSSILAGQTSTVTVSVRFDTRHLDLILKPLNWSYTIRPTGFSAVTVNLQGIPDFLNADTSRQALQVAAATAPTPQGRQAAQGFLDLLNNRTVQHRPTTPNEISDASRLVALAEPVALFVAFDGGIQSDLTASRFDDAVTSLQTAAAIVPPLRTLCDDLISSPDEAECERLLQILVDRLHNFASQTITHYESIQSQGGTILELERAAHRLGTVQRSIGDQAAASAANAVAQKHFQSYVELQNETDEQLEAIRSSEAARAPFGFLTVGERRVLWQPFGYFSLRAHRSVAREHYAAALDRLAEAGDTVRYEKVEAERDVFEQGESASTLANAMVLGSYGLAALGWGAVAGNALVQWRGLGHVVRKGRLLLR